MNIIELDQDHSAECQLFLAISGSKKSDIIKELERIISECKDDYGKPRQGVTLNGSITVEVITPRWEGTNG